MTDRKIFGLAVRLLSVYSMVYGIRELMSGVALWTHLFPSAPSEGYSPSAYILTAAILVLGGALLVKGEWLVRFAYGRES